MDNQLILEKLIDDVKEDTMRALGCTEPVAIAYAAYEAGRYIENENIQKLVISTSKNIFKNAKSVKIPNTEGRSGIDLAGAIGIYSQNLTTNPTLIFYTSK